MSELSAVRTFILHLFFYKASYHDEFLGSLAAEVSERVEPCVLRLAESRVERSVVPAVHVNRIALVDVRMASAFPLQGILDEGEVFAAVASEHAHVVLSHFCPAVACQNGF